MPDIVITPNRGTSNNPKIDFTGTSAGTIKLEVLSDGTIAWNGANGSLFSIGDSLSGSLMSVNDISGLPAFEVFSDNRVVVGQFGAKLGIGITTPQASLHVAKVGVDEQLILGSAATNRDISMAMYSGTTKAEVLRFQSSSRLMFAGVGSSITQQSFFTSGSERLTITSSGNIGIGTTSPTSLFTIQGSQSEIHVKHDATRAITIGNWDGTAQYIKSINLGVALTPFVLQASRFTFDTGNVGIGTTSPSYKLHVEGDSYSSTGFYVRNSAATFIGSTNNMSGISVNGTSYDTFIVSGGNQTITVKSGGNVGIGDPNPTKKLKIGSGTTTPVFADDGIIVDLGGTTGQITTIRSGGASAVQTGLSCSTTFGSIGTWSNHTLHIRTNNTDRITIESGGNVGIGTTSPGYKLQVQGTAYVDSTLFVNGATTIEDTFTVKTQSGSHNVAIIDYSGVAGGRIKVLVDGVVRSQIGSYSGDNTFFNAGYGGNVGIGTSTPSYLLHAVGDIYANGGWFRVSGNQGYYFETHGGGWYMTDSTWLRAYNDKAIITNNEIRGTIFVDANDTAYYVNPATGTNLNGTLVNNGGTAMTGGWNRNLLLSSTFPVIVFNSNSTKYSGIGVDYSTAAAGMYFWVNGSSADISGTATVALGINTGNFVTAYGSFRGPIYYDSDNTGYYLDPASTSDSALRIRGGTLYGPNTTWGAYLMVGGDGRQNYTDNTSTASVTTTNGNLHLDAASGSNSYINWYDGNDLLVGTGDSGTLRLRVYGPSNYTEVTGSMRAPIFYDRDDTNYYVDGNAGTALKYLRVNGDWGGSPFGSSHETFTITGTYASMCQRSTTGGLAYWLHHIAGDNNYYLYGGRGNTNGSGWDWAYRAYTNTDGNHVEFRTSARAPIFYDSDNTNYYVDPASTSITNILRANSILSPNGQTVVAADSAMPNSGGSFIHTLALGPSGNDGHILGMSWANTTSVYGAQIWLDTDPNNLMAIRSRSSAGVWNNWTYAITDWSNDQTKSGYFQSNSSLRAPIFYDSNDTNYYVDPAGTSRVNTVSFVSGATFGPYLQYSNQSNLRLQAGQQSGAVGIVGYDFNGNWKFQLYGDSSGYGFLNGNWAGWDLLKSVSGNLYLNNQSTYYIGTNEIYYNRVYGLADIRSPIFYDNDNTGYYVDPNSTSVLWRPSAATQQRWGISWRAVDAGAQRPGQSSDPDYWTTTIGWGTGYGTWADYWKYGAGFFECWGNSTDHPQGSGYVHAQGLQSGLHYANSNGTTAYGWQMVGAADAGSRWWLRGKWGGTTYSWYEIALFNRNVGGILYADLLYDAGNTGYYVDPASTSVLNYTQINYNQGNFECASNNNSSTSYSVAAIELRETSFGSTSGYLPPRLGFHWSGVVASQIGIESSGRIKIIDNPGTSYEAFIAAIVYGDASVRGPLFYDSNNTAYYFDGSSTSDAGVKIAGGIHISASNVTGNGIILADDGDIVDNNDGYCSMRFTYGVRIHSGNRTNTAKIDLKNDGSIVAAGNITAYGSPSDIRLKENLVKIENALQKVTSINGYHYNYIGKTDKLIGVIAQEVEPVLPEVVYEFSEVGSDPNTSKTKAVRYEHLTAVLIEAIKEQQKQIEQLSNELKSLKNKL